MPQSSEWRKARDAKRIEKMYSAFGIILALVVVSANLYLLPDAIDVMLMSH